MAGSRRDQLIDTALELFYREGFHATGIDKILAEAGVAKMTLYKHFKSKDELILAVLRRRDERFRDWFMREVERRTKDPRERLLVVFDVMAEWFQKSEFSGCLFINASAEFGRREDPAHALCAEHKRLLFDYLKTLSRAAGAAQPDALARSLAILVEGAIVVAHVCGDRAAAADAKAAAATLIAASPAGAGSEAA